MQTADLFDAIGPFVKKYFGAGRKRVKPQYSRIFKVGDTTEPVKDVVEYGATGLPRLKSENQPMHQDRVFRGGRRRWTAATYAISTQISYEAQDDLKYKELKRAIIGAGMSMEQLPEYLTALFLDRAFSSSYPATPDGKELCNSAHLNPGGRATFANLLTGADALSETALEKIMINLRGIPKQDGMLRPLEMQKLVVPKDLYPTALKLSMTKKQVGTANNTESVVAGLEVQPFDYLGSATRYFVLTNYEDDEGLFFDFRKRPTAVEEDRPSMLSMIFGHYCRIMWGCEDPRKIYGSNAA